MLNKSLLDHGYVKLIESWGSDERVIEAARMSTDKGFQGWPQDEKLLKYLWDHKHYTPFEMAGMIIEVQAPIFVFREWHRHRTQSYNELSARYTELPNLAYLPDTLRSQSTKNKQGGIETGFTQTDHDEFCRDCLGVYQAARGVYEKWLARGMERGLARIPLPVAQYSRMRASANLRNWLAFITLRAAPDAQWEIRQYADAVGSFVAECFPRTWELFNGISI